METFLEMPRFPFVTPWRSSASAMVWRSCEVTMCRERNELLEHGAGGAKAGTAGDAIRNCGRKGDGVGCGMSKAGWPEEDGERTIMNSAQSWMGGATAALALGTMAIRADAVCSAMTDTSGFPSVPSEGPPNGKWCERIRCMGPSIRL